MGIVRLGTMGIVPLGTMGIVPLGTMGIVPLGTMGIVPLGTMGVGGRIFWTISHTTLPVSKRPMPGISLDNWSHGRPD
ncbi:hypothetical protein [Nonomuraea sp. NPDC002799]